MHSVRLAFSECVRSLGNSQRSWRAEMKARVQMVVVLLFALWPTLGIAAGDFPISCKSWSGTVLDRSGIDGPRAEMRGIVAKADVQEYCERDPGGETRASGGKLSLQQCVAKYVAETRDINLTSSANCKAGTIVFRYGKRATDRAKFPLRPDADTSCASPLSNLIPQFKILCPAAVKRFRLSRFLQIEDGLLCES